MTYSPRVFFLAVLGGIMLALAMHTVSFAQPSMDYIRVKNLPANEPMILGADYEIEFNGSAQTLRLVTDLQILAYSPECSKADYGVTCPSGMHSMFVHAEPNEMGGDIFTGFTLSAVTPETTETLVSYAVPLVGDDEVTPYLVTDVDFTETSTFIDVWVINTTDNAYTGTVEVDVFGPGSVKQSQEFGVDVPANDRLIYQVEIPMDQRGRYIVSFQIGNSTYYPLGGIIDFPHGDRTKLFLPAIVVN
jgi:hypothetical protein